jgi:hypothetical protein
MGTPPLATAPHYDDDPNTPRPWHRRHWVIVAVLVVVSLAIGTATWWGLRSDDNAEPAPPAPAASPPPVSNGQQGYLADTVDRYGSQIRVPRDPAGLPLPQIGTKGGRGLNDPAAGVQWQQLYGSGAALFSTSDGPTGISVDGLAQGISNTPQGSVIAASQILGRLYYGPTAVREATLSQLVLGPPEAKATLLGLELPDRQMPASRFIRIDPQYTNTFARISLATGPKSSSDYASGQYYSVSTVTMVWDEGKWKYRIPDEGLTRATGPTPVESVTGWTRW